MKVTTKYNDKKITLIIASLFLCSTILFTSCSGKKDPLLSGEVTKELPVMSFETIAEWDRDHINSVDVVILRDKATDVLYMHPVSGGLELMVEADGSPLTYKEYRDRAGEL